MSEQSGGRYRDALHSRDFRLMLTAFLIDETGSWSYNVVLIVYVYQRTGSPTWIAATTAAGWIPRMLFSAHAGVLADRFERARLLLASALLSSVVMAGLTVLVAADGPVILVLALAALTTTLGTVYLPASGALVPDVVGERDLTAANALFGVLENLVVVLGPALGGLLLLTGGPTWGMALNTASFLSAAALVSRLTVRSRGSAGEAGETFAAQLAAGVRALRDAPVAGVLVGYCALGTAVYGASTVLYVPISGRLGTGADGYSYLLAAAALGGVLGASVVNRVGASSRLAAVILGGILLLALPFAATAVVSAPVLGAGLQVVSGGGMVIVDVLTITALQRDLPRELLSRVLGIMQTAALGAALVASFAVAQLLRAAGLTPTLLVVGFGFSLIAIFALRPLLRADRAAAATVRALASRVAVLEQLDLFSAAAAPTLERLASAMQEQTVPADAVVLREGDHADALWILLSGTVEASAQGEAERPRVLRTIAAPNYFGEIGLLRGLPRTATVRAVEPSTLARIPAEDFLSSIQGAALNRTVLSRAAAWLAYSHPRLSTTVVETPVGQYPDADQDAASGSRDHFDSSA